MKYTIDKNIFKILITSAVGAALVISLLTANSVNNQNRVISDIDKEIDTLEADINTYYENQNNLTAGFTKTLSDLQYELDLIKKHAEDLEKEDTDMQLRLYKLERKVKNK